MPTCQLLAALKKEILLSQEGDWGLLEGGSFADVYIIHTSIFILPRPTYGWGLNMLKFELQTSCKPVTGIVLGNISKLQGARYIIKIKKWLLTHFSILHILFIIISQNCHLGEMVPFFFFFFSFLFFSFFFSLQYLQLYCLPQMAVQENEGQHAISQFLHKSL